MKIRPRSEVADRCRELSDELGAALSRLPDAGDDPAVVAAVWRGEGLGTLFWALRLTDLPPYDRPFDHPWLVRIPFIQPELRDRVEIERAREAARLWHWRARMAALEGDPGFAPPPPWRSAHELVASVARRGHEQGLLPAPVNDDFPALDFAYRWATPRERADLAAIADERHRALAWTCDAARTWDAPLDT
jgi:hypothetical protein